MKKQKHNQKKKIIPPALRFVKVLLMRRLASNLREGDENGDIGKLYDGAEALQFLFFEYIYLKTKLIWSN